MLTVFKYEVHIGPKAEGVLFAWGRGSGTVEPYLSGRADVPQLTIPWRTELQEDPPVGALLDWRSALSDFTGCKDEMRTLRKWATSGPAISARFVTGEGGVGKTRLAAEFAQEIREKQEGWSAGFVDLREADGFQPFAAGSKGTLLIVDYPESKPDAVEELFSDLAGLEEHGVRLRLVLLTRQPSNVWLERIERSKALSCFNPIQLA